MHHYAHKFNVLHRHDLSQLCLVAYESACNNYLSAGYMKAKQPYMVGITGGSGMGKTHFLHQLRHRFSLDELCIISQDDYYKKSHQHERDENGHINFDKPECIDLHQLTVDIEQLHQGRRITREEYLFQHTDKEPAILQFHPAPIIVCEGMFVFYYQELFSRFNLKIFVQAEENIALERRLKRDVNERNIAEDFVLYQWKNHVMPAYRQYLLPFMARADIIINNNSHFDNSLMLVENHFRWILEK